MPRALLIPADLAAPARDVTYDGLGDLQTLVGGHIELIALANDDCDMFGNSEGKLLGLPANVRATALWRRSWQQNDGELDARILAAETITGDVVVIGPADGHGDTMDLPDGAAAHVRRVCDALTGNAQP